MNHSRRAAPGHATPPHLAFLPGFDAVPVGAVIAYAGKLPPSEPSQKNIEAGGWMLCDGRELDTARYPELFWAIGHQYDDGQLAGKFRLPDYRGYFLRGNDTDARVDQDGASRSPGGTGGAGEVGSRQEDALQKHEHGYKLTAATAGPGGTPSATVAGEQLSELGPTDSLAAPGTVRVSVHETRPNNISVHYLIRVTGQFAHRPFPHHPGV